MNQQYSQEIIEGQRQDWNRVAGGWEKWDRFFDEQMAFLNHRLVADARLRAGMRVLDLGSGTGYPALLGAQTVGPSGGVIGLDLAEQMLAVARRKATTLGLANVTFRTGDVTALPFDANSFDAVTSRFCSSGAVQAIACKFESMVVARGARCHTSSLKLRANS